MSEVINSLEAKPKVGFRTVYLNDEQMSTVKSILRAFRGVQYRYIEHEIPHHLQLRPRDMVQRLQLLEDRCSHKQRLWEPERIFGIEDTRCLMRDLLVDPKQGRIQRSTPLKLYSVGFGGDEGISIDPIS